MRASAFCAWLRILLAALAGTGSSAIADEVSGAVRAGEFKDLPAPVSVAPEQYVAEPRIDPMARLATRFDQIGADRLLVVLATVQSVVTSSRTVPRQLLWGRGPQIVTTLGLQVETALCGNQQPKGIIKASYVGGVLADGAYAPNELTPRVLPIGSSHVFILKEYDGEFFLELGREDLLRRNVDGVLIDSNGIAVDIDVIKRQCP